MKILLTLFFSGYLFVPFAFGIGHYSTGDTLHVWAYHGLVLRDAPSAKGAKKATIPYGDQVVVLDSVRTKAYSVEEFPGFSLKGYWSKVRYNSLEGWVFDGYLSKYAAIKKMDKADLERSWQDLYPPYGKKEFGLVSKRRFELESDKPTRDSLNFREVYKYKNGVIFEFRHGRSDGGWNAVNYTFPDLSFEECYLLFVYNTEFFFFDPHYHPERSAASLPSVSLRDKTHLTISRELCTYTFEKKGNLMHIHIFCSC